jgi:hypothetical protein
MKKTPTRDEVQGEGDYEAEQRAKSHSKGEGSLVRKLRKA